jgi:hypothetical protein
MTVKTLVTLPRSLVKFHLRGPLLSFAGTTLLVPMLGAFEAAIKGEESYSIVEWGFGLWMWGLSLGLLGLYYAIRHRVNRAISFYQLVTLAGVPLGAVILVGGFRGFTAHLGGEAARWLGAGLFIGLITLPWAVRARQVWFRAALETGHLSESLDRGKAQWDPRQDNRYVEEDPRIARPGCLMRLLPWVGPAIGASLSDVFGRATALSIGTLILVSIGHALFYFNLRYLFTNMLEFRRLERELGRPILLLSDREFELRSRASR